MNIFQNGQKQVKMAELAMTGVIQMIDKIIGIAPIFKRTGEQIILNQYGHPPSRIYLIIYYSKSSHMSTLNYANRYSKTKNKTF